MKKWVVLHVQGDYKKFWILNLSYQWDRNYSICICKDRYFTLLLSNNSFELNKREIPLITLRSRCHLSHCVTAYCISMIHIQFILVGEKKGLMVINATMHHSDAFVHVSRYQWLLCAGILHSSVICPIANANLLILIL